MIAHPAEICDFRGMPLTVYRAEGDSYIVLQAIAEMFSLPWESTRADAISEEGKALYGSRVLHILPADRHIPDPEKAAAANHLAQSLCIRLESMTLFLLRVETGDLRAAGHIEAADRLLALQQEWGDALYRIVEGSL